MSSSPQLKAVIFDLDGVLVSTSKFHAQAWEALVRSVGHEPPADLEDLVRGISRLASLKIALGEHVVDYTEAELEEMAARKNALYLEATQNISPADLYPGALALFDDLKRNGIKIVLGSASKNARPILDGMGITPYFDAIADGHAYTYGKPHPDVFLSGARMVGATPEECIVVEDAPAGVNAALDGGFVAVGMGNAEALQHAHVNIDSLEEINAARLQTLQAQYRADNWTITDPTLPEPAMPFALTMTLDGTPITLVNGKRVLDLRSGMLTEAWTCTMAGGTLRVIRRSFTDMAVPGRVGVQYQLESDGVSGTLAIAVAPSLPVQEATQCGPRGLLARPLHSATTETTALGVLDHPTTTYCVRIDETPGIRAEVPVQAGSLIYIDHMSLQQHDAPEELIHEPFAQARVAATGSWQRYWENADTVHADATARREAFLRRLRLESVTG